ncbi:hypothetical protein F5Y06DRAFT_275840 [Hypoxylon sp. FL0890]|nr:hypothetical protein F5Y06DRAFT_275840 [Hypoxylon sp. FL0890]
MTAHTPHQHHTDAHKLTLMSDQSGALVANLGTTTLNPPRPAATRAGVISAQPRRVL